MNKISRMILLFLIFFGVLANPEKIAALDIESKINYRELTENQVQIVSISNIMNEQLNQTLEVPIYYKYDYVIVSSETKWGYEYAGNQPSGGSRFSTGGGFYWTDSNGPTGSIAFSWIIISVSYGTVNSSSLGYFISVPDNINFYKLKIGKQIKVNKTAVYGYPTSGGPREFLYFTYPYVLEHYDFIAVKQ